MKKYRILEQDGLFYPQYSSIFFFYSFFKYYSSPFDYWNGQPIKKRAFSSLEQAKEYIDERKKAEEKKIHPYS